MHIQLKSCPYSTLVMELPRGGSLQPPSQDCDNSQAYTDCEHNRHTECTIPDCLQTSTAQLAEQGPTCLHPLKPKKVQDPKTRFAPHLYDVPGLQADSELPCQLDCTGTKHNDVSPER